MSAAARQVDVWEQAIRETRNNPLWGAKNILGLTLDPWQEELIEAVWDAWRFRTGKPTRVNHTGANKITVRAMHGPGKEQPVTEPVLTPSGWVAIGALRPGDELFAADGTITQVVSMHPQGVKKVYRLTMSDGSYARAGEEHLWRVHERIGGTRKWATLQTRDMIDRGVTDESGVVRYRMPTCDPVRYASTTLPIDPYILGAWLGDGYCSGGLICKPDQGLWDELGITGKAENVPQRIVGLTTKLRAVGLFDKHSYERFIPEIYKRASVDDRHAILQGLLDTDGWIQDDGAGVYYSSASKTLADDVTEIVRSLGGQVRRWVKDEPKYTHGGEVRTGRPANIVKITLPERFKPFRSATKANKFAHIPDNDRNRKRALSRYIVDISHDGEEESVCISIAHSSRLYITRDHIVTHNTAGVSFLIHLWQMVRRGNHPSLVTAPKQDHLKNKFFAAMRKTLKSSVPEYRDMVEIDAFKATWCNDPDWSIVGETASDPQNMAGYHDDFLLVVVDEASAVREEFFPVLEGAVSTGFCPVMVLIGNPTSTQGTFALSHLSPKTADHYYRLHVSLDKTTRVSRSWVQQMVDKYGADSDVVRVRCYGEFPKESPDQLIYLHWVHQAFEREIPAHLLLNRPRKFIMADVADGGKNSSVVTVIYDYGEYDLWAKQVLRDYPRSESPILVGDLVARFWEDERCNAEHGDRIIVDAMGVGAGTAGYLMQKGLPVIQHRGGESSDDAEKYRNRRTQSYVVEAEMFRTGRICIAPDFVADEAERLDLEAQLTCIRRKPFQARVDEIESKKDLIARMLSPDRADSAAMRYGHMTGRASLEDIAIIQTSTIQDAIDNASPFYADAGASPWA